MSCYSVKIFWNNFANAAKVWMENTPGDPQGPLNSILLHLANHCPSARWKQNRFGWRSEAPDHAERSTLSHIRSVCAHLSAHTCSKPLEISSVRRGGVPNDLREGGRVGVRGAKVTLQVQGCQELSDCSISDPTLLCHINLTSLDLTCSYFSGL